MVALGRGADVRPPCRGNRQRHDSTNMVTQVGDAALVRECPLPHALLQGARAVGRQAYQGLLRCTQCTCEQVDTGVATGER